MAEGAVILMLILSILFVIFVVWVGVTIIQTCDQVTNYIKQQQEKDVHITQ